MRDKGVIDRADRAHGVNPASEVEAANDLYEIERHYGLKGWFKKALKNYARFKGRARRKEYWMFVVSITLISIISYFIDLFLLHQLGFPTYGAVTALMLSTTVVPLLAVGARRLHDIGRSGWWQLLWVLPSIITLVISVIANMYAVKSDIKPIGGLSKELAAVSLTVIIAAWFTITTLLTINTSPKMNKYGLPAKRIGKREALKEKKVKTELKEITMNKPLD